MRVPVVESALCRTLARGWRRFALTALCALGLSLVGVAPILSQTPATLPPKAPAAKAAGRAGANGGGMHEGIKVHGHWMIEVRNPAGRLLSHAEFENSLVSSGAGQLLPGFLAQAGNGQVVSFTPGEWGILLGDPKSPPCSANLYYPFGNDSVPILPLPYGGGPYCVITQIAPPAAIYPTNCGSNNSGCAYNLGLGITNNSGLQLSGSVISQSSGLVSQVQTILSACANRVAPSTCWSETGPDFVSPLGGDLVFPFTAATLPVSNSTSTPCGGKGQISCAVNVPEAGDSINVTVTISFQ
jgi:hypothetical protein